MSLSNTSTVNTSVFVCSYWDCYKQHIAFAVIIEYGIEVAFDSENMDAFTLLHAQTPDAKERYTRDNKYFALAFKHLMVKPAVVKKPIRAGEQAGQKMFGILAEVQLKKVCTHIYTQEQTQQHTQPHLPLQDRQQIIK